MKLSVVVVLISKYSEPALWFGGWGCCFSIYADLIFLWQKKIWDLHLAQETYLEVCNKIQFNRYNTSIITKGTYKAGGCVSFSLLFLTNVK